MKRLLCAALSALVLLSLSACGAPAGDASAASGSAGSSASSSAGRDSSETPPQEPSPSAKIDRLLSAMTLEEKVGQLFFVRVPSDGALADVTAYHLGGYLLFGRDTKGLTANQLIQTIRLYQEAAAADTGIPLLIGADEEGGTVVRVSSNPHLRERAFLSPQQLYALGGMEEIISDTHEKDVLLRALGINVNLSPVCDVSNDPGDFIYPRTFGQDADATAQYVSAAVGQMALDGMGSVLKHFPGYGNNADTHTGVAVDSRPLERFESSDFLPFRAGIAAGQGSDADQTAAVLVSHNLMTAVDKQLPASLSPAVHTLLRQSVLGTEAEPFDGVVMTDDLAMDAVNAYAESGDAATLALLAGNDLLVTTDYRAQIPQVLAAVESGALSESTIDAACRRVLQWKLSLGLL